MEVTRGKVRAKHDDGHDSVIKASNKVKYSPNGARYVAKNKPHIYANEEGFYSVDMWCDGIDAGTLDKALYRKARDFVRNQNDLIATELGY